ncbi:peptidase family M49-domain-containing protein, partial [Entophlyctis helioformis]
MLRLLLPMRAMRAMRAMSASVRAPAAASTTAPSARSSGQTTTPPAFRLSLSSIRTTAQAPLAPSVPLPYLPYLPYQPRLPPSRLLAARPMSSDTAAAAYLSSVPTLFHADTSLPIVRLEISKHFKALTPTERLYAHFIGRSSWAAARVISETMSHDSPALVSLFLDLFTEPSTRRSASPKLRSDMATLKATSGASDATWTLFLEYAVQVLDNLSNFRSFGDRKFVPRLPPSDFEAILAKIAPPGVASQFAALKPVIFDLKPASRCLIGFPGDGHVSGYYSPDIVKADVDLVQKALESKGLSALNTRLFKLADGSGYEIRVASADRSKPAETLTLEGGKTVKVVYGDYHEAMAAAADAMASALPHAANDNQRKMVQAYVESFRTGSMEAHRESQKHWIRDVGPIVESNIGFIETYRDPAGVRAEWEGFAAVVNKEMTLKFQKLV